MNEWILKQLNASIRRNTQTKRYSSVATCLVHHSTLTGLESKTETNNYLAWCCFLWCLKLLTQILGTMMWFLTYMCFEHLEYVGQISYFMFFHIYLWNCVSNHWFWQFNWLSHIDFWPNYHVFRCHGNRRYFCPQRDTAICAMTM